MIEEEYEEGAAAPLHEDEPIVHWRRKERRKGRGGRGRRERKKIGRK